MARSRSQTPVKGMKRAFTSAREVDSANVLALVPVPLGPGAMGAPMPSEGDSRSLENRRGTCTRLRDTIRMMNRSRV